MDYPRRVTNPVDLLTSRERVNLTMIAVGRANKDRQRANLSVYTMESPGGSLMEKLNLHYTGDIVDQLAKDHLT